MTQPDDPPKATLKRPPDATGRDGAMDFAARGAPLDLSEERFCLVLGEAALSLWSGLPQPVQEALFERAVLLGHQSERDEMLREQLAKFLHDHHKRTVE